MLLSRPISRAQSISIKFAEMLTLLEIDQKKHLAISLQHHHQEASQYHSSEIKTILLFPARFGGHV